MFIKQLLEAVLGKLNEHERKRDKIDDKVLELIDEVGRLKDKYAKELSDAERWGDLSDKSHFRTARVNELKRKIQDREQMIETLRR